MPTIRPDAVDHYAALLDSDALPSEALCLTAVRGLSVEEALTRFDGFPGGRETSLDVAGHTSVNAYPDELPIIVADHRDGWTLLAEDNGFHGSMPEVLSQLSPGTVAASVYWNVNLVSRASLAQDGQVLAVFDFVGGGPPDGEDPEKIAPFLHDLDFDDAYRMCAAALAFLERVSGVRVPGDWSAQSHPASVIADPTRFEPSHVSSWLSINAPDVAAAVLHTSRPALRAVAALAATRACQAAGIDDPAVLHLLAEDVDALPQPERAQHRQRFAAQSREAYGHALHLRWDRCQPPDMTADPAGFPRAGIVRRRIDPTPERALNARAHALGAVHTRLAEDPADALAWAMFNACQANRERWPALLAELTTHLPVATT
jgi:hypothetical protein